MTSIIIGLGNFFEFTFKILSGGYFLNWILLAVGIFILAYWCKRIIDFGQEDKKYDGDRL